MRQCIGLLLSLSLLFPPNLSALRPVQPHSSTVSQSLQEELTPDTGLEEKQVNRELLLSLGVGILKATGAENALLAALEQADRNDDRVVFAGVEYTKRDGKWYFDAPVRSIKAGLIAVGTLLPLEAGAHAVTIEALMQAPLSFSEQVARDAASLLNKHLDSLWERQKTGGNPSAEIEFEGVLYRRVLGQGASPKPIWSYASDASISSVHAGFVNVGLVLPKSEGMAEVTSRAFQKPPLSLTQGTAYDVARLLNAHLDALWDAQRARGNPSTEIVYAGIVFRRVRQPMPVWAFSKDAPMTLLRPGLVALGAVLPMEANVNPVTVLAFRRAPLSFSGSLARKTARLLNAHLDALWSEQQTNGNVSAEVILEGVTYRRAYSDRGTKGKQIWTYPPDIRVAAVHAGLIAAGAILPMAVGDHIISTKAFFAHPFLTRRMVGPAVKLLDDHLHALWDRQKAEGNPSAEVLFDGVVYRRAYGLGEIPKPIWIYPESTPGGSLARALRLLGMDLPVDASTSGLGELAALAGSEGQWLSGLSVDVALTESPKTSPVIVATMPGSKRLWWETQIARVHLASLANMGRRQGRQKRNLKSPTLPPWRVRDEVMDQPVGVPIGLEERAVTRDLLRDAGVIFSALADIREALFQTLEGLSGEGDQVEWADVIYIKRGNRWFVNASAAALRPGLIALGAVLPIPDGWHVVTRDALGEPPLALGGLVAKRAVGPFNAHLDALWSVQQQAGNPSAEVEYEGVGYRRVLVMGQKPYPVWAYPPDASVEALQRGLMVLGVVLPAEPGWGSVTMEGFKNAPLSLSQTVATRSATILNAHLDALWAAQQADDNASVDVEYEGVVYRRVLSLGEKPVPMWVYPPDVSGESLRRGLVALGAILPAEPGWKSVTLLAFRRAPLSLSQTVAGRAAKLLNDHLDVLWAAQQEADNLSAEVEYEGGVYRYALGEGRTGQPGWTYSDGLPVATLRSGLIRLGAVLPIEKNWRPITKQHFKKPVVPFSGEVGKKSSRLLNAHLDVLQATQRDEGNPSADVIYAGGLYRRVMTEGGHPVPVWAYAPHVSVEDLRRGLIPLGAVLPIEDGWSPVTRNVIWEVLRSLSQVTAQQASNLLNAQLDTLWADQQAAENPSAEVIYEDVVYRRVLAIGVQPKSVWAYAPETSAEQLRTAVVGLGVDVPPLADYLKDVVALATSRSGWLSLDADAGLEEGIEVYPGETLDSFDFVPKSEPRNVKWYGDVRWKWVRDAGGAVLRHYTTRTFSRGDWLYFKIDGNRYKTPFKQSERDDLRLLIQVNGDAKPVIAYDEQTGEVVWPPETKIELYSGVALNEQGELNTKKEPQFFDSISNLSHTADWSTVQAQGGAVLTHYPAHAHYTKYQFRFRKNDYPTTIDSNPDEPLLLRIQLDAQGLPVVAYDEATGQEVYRSTEVKAPIQLFLGGRLRGATFDAPGTPVEFTSSNSIRRNRWADVRSAGGAVFRHYRTKRQNNRWIFTVNGRTYPTDIRIKDQPVAPYLLLELNAESEPLRAYDEGTGEEVYRSPEVAVEPIRLYLGESLDGVDFRSDVVPVEFEINGMRSQHWKAIRGAGGGVLEHYALTTKKDHEHYLVRIDGEHYDTGLAKTQAPTRLLIQVDSENLPVSAYDEQTRQPIYLKIKKSMELYVGATLKGSTFEPVVLPDFRFLGGTGLRKKQFDAVRAAGGGVMMHYPAGRRDGQITLEGKLYPTRLAPAPGQVYRLLIQLDEQAQPILAYDQATGEQVLELGFSVAPEIAQLAASNGDWLSGDASLRFPPSSVQSRVLKPSAESLTTVRGYSVHSVWWESLMLGKRFGSDEIPMLRGASRHEVLLRSSDPVTVHRTHMHPAIVGLEEIEVYLRAQLDGSVLEPDQASKTFSSVQAIREEDVVLFREAGGGVLRNFPARSSKKLSFHIFGRTYRSTHVLDTQGVKPLLDIEVDRDLFVVAARLAGTEIEVYRAPENRMGVYLGAELKTGGMDGLPPADEQYDSKTNMSRKIWSRVQEHGGAVISYHPMKRHHGKWKITIAGKDYYPGVDAPAGSSPYALVEVDAQLQLVAAYHQSTGEELYRAQVTPETTIELYLGATLSSAAFEPKVKPDVSFGSARRIAKQHWQRVRDSGGAVLRHYTFSKGSGNNTLYVDGQRYPVDLPYEPQKDRRLLVALDGNVEVLVAYDEETGEEVYRKPKVAQSRIALYLGVELQGSVLETSVVPTTFATTRVMPKTTWDAVREAGGAVLEHYPTHRHNQQHTFKVNGQMYPLGIPFEGERMYLLVAIDAESRPLVAYDHATQQRVYVMPSGPKTQIEMYLGETLKGIDFVSDVEPQLFYTASGLTKNYWDAVRQAEGAVFRRYPTFKHSSWTNFRIAGEVYYTKVPWNAENRMRLSIQVDALGKPIVAYDERTGDEVFGPSVAGEIIELYLGQVLVDGDSVPEGASIPLLSPSGFRKGYRERVRQAGGAVFRYYPTTKHSVWTSFSLNGVTYDTNVRFDSSNPEMRVRIQVDAESRPIVAYDEATGHLVYGVAPGMRSLVELAVSNGSWLSGDSALPPAPVQSQVLQPPVESLPMAESYSVHSVWWESIALGRRFASDQASSWRNTSRHEAVLRSSDPARAHNTSMHAAIVGLEEIEVYLGAELDGPDFDPTNEPLQYGSIRSLRTQHWDLVRNAGGAVIVNYRTRKKRRNEKRYSININERVYNTAPIDSDASHLNLILHVDANGVLARAYDLDTREQVYPDVVSDSIDLYVGASLKGSSVFVPSRAPNKSFFHNNHLRTPDWDAVRAAGGAVLRNYRSRTQGDDNRAPVVRIAGQDYSIVPSEGSALSGVYLIELDGDLRPVTVFDMETGNPVEVRANRIQVHLGGTFEDAQGTFVATGVPQLFGDPSALKHIWAEVASAGGAVMLQYPISTGSSGTTQFRLKTEPYVTDLPHDSSALLNIQVDALGRPVVAYDSETGQLAYDVNTRIALYPGVQQYEPDISPDKAWRFYKKPKGISTKSWKKVRESGGAMLTHYPAVDNHGRVSFFMRSKGYATNLQTKDLEGGELPLLVVLTNAEGVPFAAYDQKTQQQVFPDGQLALFLGGRLDADGSFVPGRQADGYFPNVGALRKPAWSRVAEAGGAVVLGYPLTLHHGRYGIKAAGTHYPLVGISEQGPPEMLAVQFDAGAVPTVAYDKVRDQQFTFETGHSSVFPEQLTGFVDLATSDAEWLGDIDLADNGPQKLHAPPSALFLQALGLEEFFQDWSAAAQGTDVVVISDQVLNGVLGVQVRETLARMPHKLARRTILVGQGWQGLEERNAALQILVEPGLEATAVAILQQVPEPQSVWVVGQDAVGLESMLDVFGIAVRLVDTPQTLTQFVLQLGKILGVPQAILERTREFLESYATLDLAA